MLKKEPIEFADGRNQLGVDGNSGNGKKGCTPAYVKKEPIEFTDGRNVVCEKKRRFKSDSKAVGLSSWKDGVATYRDWKDFRKNKLGNFSHVKFELN